MRVILPVPLRTWSNETNLWQVGSTCFFWIDLLYWVKKLRFWSVLINVNLLNASPRNRSQVRAEYDLGPYFTVWWIPAYEIKRRSKNSKHVYFVEITSNTRKIFDRISFLFLRIFGVGQRNFTIIIIIILFYKEILVVEIFLTNMFFLFILFPLFLELTLLDSMLCWCHNENGFFLMDQLQPEWFLDR